jgi:hypothetical protein
VARSGWRRGHVHEVESGRSGAGAAMEWGGAEAQAQAQADDEVGDRPRRGDQVGVQVAAGGVGRVVVQPDAPAGVLVPGPTTGAGRSGWRAPPSDPVPPGWSWGVQAARRSAVEHDGTDQPVRGSLRWGAAVSTPLTSSSPATAARWLSRCRPRVGWCSIA